MGLLDGVDWQGKIFKNGAWTIGRGGDYPIIEPATGAQLGRMGLATAEDVAEAGVSAAAAQREWAALPHPARAAVLRKAGDLWQRHADEISGWNIREVGAVPGMAGFALHVAAEECYEAASLPSRPYGELLPSEQPRLSMARRMPAGVVSVISPFNVPIILGIRSVAPALALGNAVILKPDPRTAVTGGTLMARIFAEAGLPAGVLQMLPGGADVGEALVTDPNIRVISFTGSTPVGRRIGEIAGRHLKRAHLELGGNSALLVLDDADVEQAVNLAAWGSFFNQGQICMTTGRHLVADRLYDEFVERLADKAGKLPVGNPATEQVALGPVIDAGQRDKIHGLVTASTGQGAVVAVLPADGAGRRAADRARVRRRGVRAGRADHPGGLGRGGRRPRRGQRIRSLAGHRHPRRDARARGRRTDPDRHRAHQRPDRQRRGERAVRRGAGLRHRLPLRRRGRQHRGVHRNPLDHHARRAAGLSVLITPFRAIRSDQSALSNPI
jgi:benzaldehyde dehydrogenase (NAD)